MSNITNVTMSAIRDNGYLIAAAPAIGIGASIGIRAALGFGGGLFKIVSKISEFVGSTFLDSLFSKGIDAFANNMIYQATHNFSRELYLGIALAALTATGIAIPVLLEQPELSCLKEIPSLEELKNFTGPHLERLGNWTEEAKPILKEHYNHTFEWVMHKWTNLKN